MTTTINADNGVSSGSAGLKSSADSSGVLALQTNGTTAMTVGTDQAVTMAGRTTNPTTISVGAATPSTSGVGITFPATQSASTDANTLDDYEEGTWTPSIEGTTTSGTTTYSTKNAKYTKIGRLATVITYVAWTAGTGTGNLRMTGLPFVEGGGATYGAVTLSEFDNITMTALYYPSAYVQNATSQIIFEQAPVGGGVSIAVPFDGAGQVILTATYQTST